jgi:hypothetical protein
LGGVVVMLSDLEVLRGHPLAAGFDHVLRSIHDRHEAVTIYARHVTSEEPAVFVQIRLAGLEIRASDERTRHHEVATCFPIPRQFIACFIHNLHLHPVAHSSRFACNVNALFKWQRLLMRQQ